MYSIIVIIDNMSFWVFFMNIIIFNSNLLSKLFPVHVFCRYSICVRVCVHTVSLLLSVCSLCVCVCYPLRVCVLAHTYNPLIQCYGVSTAVLNNAKSLRLTTEQTQWGLSVQDIPFCIMLCCTFVPSCTE